MTLDLNQPIGFENFGSMSTGKIKEVCGFGLYKVEWSDGYEDNESYHEEELKPLYTDIIGIHKDIVTH